MFSPLSSALHNPPNHSDTSAFTAFRNNKTNTGIIFNAHSEPLVIKLNSPKGSEDWEAEFWQPFLCFREIPDH